MAIDPKIVSYQINWLNRWKEQHGGKLAEAPPLNQRAPTQSNQVKVVSSPAPKQPKPDPLDKMVDDLNKVANSFSRFKTWLDTPDPPKPPKKIHVSTPAKEIAPPYDLQDIPGAMDSLKLPVSAKLLRKWFANPLNYATSGSRKLHGIQQDGNPYPSSCIDKNAIKLDWVKSFSRGLAGYNEITEPGYLFKSDARNVIANKIRPYTHLHYLDTWNICNGDIDLIHKYFQFQLNWVAASVMGKLASWIGDNLQGLATDDLMGALGGFAFYAAIGDAEIGTRPFSAQKTVTINTVYIYVRNPYSFFDDDPVNASQYLGHWSKKSVCLLWEDQLAYMRGREKLQPSYAFKSEDGQYYYPIHNKDFRAWQLKHKQGGDMILYSNAFTCRPIYNISFGL